MYSIKLINVHFWLHTAGIVLYIVAMWISGVMQGLMWRAVNTDGTLTYSFVESLTASYPIYFMRFGGGVLAAAGFVIKVYNMIKTIKAQAGSLEPVAAV